MALAMTISLFPMLKASGNTRATIVRCERREPMIPRGRGTGVNSHTFISFSNAIQQTYFIQRALAGGCGRRMRRPATAAERAE